MVEYPMGFIRENVFLNHLKKVQLAFCDVEHDSS